MTLKSVQRGSKRDDENDIQNETEVKVQEGATSTKKKTYFLFRVFVNPKFGR